MNEHVTYSYSGSSTPELRLILLGNLGCGKTSSADTILGQLSPISPVASRSCQLRQGSSEGRSVTVVEAPRWYWNGGKMENSVQEETERALSLAAPGPHAILLLVPVSQFTEMECRVPAAMEDVFGEESLDYTLVLLTCGDYLMGRTVEEYLQKEHPGLRQIIDRCGGRYHVINNRQRQDRQQVRELLEKVDKMVQQKGVYNMKTVQERELERQVNERQRELMESYRGQREVTSTRVTNTETQWSSASEMYSAALERRRKQERDEVEGRAGVRQVSNGLHSPPAAERQSHAEQYDDRQVKRTPSFKLNADGALLSQMSEVTSPQRIVTTLHQRINSFEGRSPEASRTSSPRSPVFSSSSSPTAAASSFPFPSSSSLSSSTYASTSPTTPPSPSFSSSFAPSSSSTSSLSWTSSPSSASSSTPELRLVLLGRSGAGKSAVGNIILGRKEFESNPDSFTAVTKECEKKKAVVEGRRVAVVDTPDWFNSENTPDEVRAQISSCVALSSPGPHAFLLCVPLDQPAKTELQALRAMETVFGPGAVQNHTLILFTYIDRLRESGEAGDKSVEEYIASQRGDLLSIVEKCRDRFHVMESGRRNVAELLEKVEQTVKEAGGQCYSSPAFQEAESRVRQRQVEIARERRDKAEQPGDVGLLRSERPVLYSYMQPVAEAEEEVRADEIEKTRDEAEMSVSNMDIQSLPAITASSLSPSLLNSLMEKMQCSAKMMQKLLADGSVLVGEGAKKVKGSPVWGTVGSGAQNVQRMVVDSPVWEKLGEGAKQASKAMGDRMPKVVVDGSEWVGSGAKAAASSPVWGKVGSGAKMVAGGSVRLGSELGTGAKNLAQSPVWGKVGTGAKSGAKLVADSSMRVGAGIGAGAKKVAQSPVWEKVGSGAKAGAKAVAESPVWEKVGNTVKQVPKVVVVGALLGLLVGVFFGGVIGGAVGAAAGSAATEVGRRKLGNKTTSEKADDAVSSVGRNVNDGVDSLVRQGEKVLKTE